MSFYEDVSEVCSSIVDPKESDSVSFFEDESEVVFDQKAPRAPTPTPTPPQDFYDGVVESETEEEEEKSEKKGVHMTFTFTPASKPEENDCLSKSEYNCINVVYLSHQKLYYYKINNTINVSRRRRLNLN